MKILNVSFGLFAFLPHGWAFMLLVVLLEAYLQMKLLKLDKFPFSMMLLSNGISGFVGIVGSMLATGGWWLVVWIPWVSNHELESLSSGFILYFALALILTILLELSYELMVLKRTVKKKKIVMANLIRNVISTAFASVVLYSISFSNLRLL